MESAGTNAAASTVNLEMESGSIHPEPASAPSAPSLTQQLKFWVGTLSDAPHKLALMEGKTRAEDQRHLREKLGQLSFDVPEELTTQVRAFATQQGLTVFVTLLASWAALLARRSGQNDLVIGTRGVPDKSLRRGCTEGDVNDVLALRLKIEPALAIELYLHRVAQTVEEALQNNSVPFQDVINALEPLRGREPICHVWMEYTDRSRGDSASPRESNRDIRVLDLEDNRASVNCELAFHVYEMREGLRCRLEYAAEMFSRDAIERLAASWYVAVRGIVADGQQVLGRLPILTADERNKVLSEFNRTASLSSENRLIHQLFEEQVDRTPTAVAVVYGDLSVTYAELNRRANSLARDLVARGIKPDQLVGLCVERSVDMVVGLLAILKSGGAYVPLDPGYPIDRLQYMLEDSAPRLLLTQKHLRTLLKFPSAQTIAIDQVRGAHAEQRDTNIASDEIGLTSSHLAYVIYTSGSTGLPKGAMNEHRGMANRLLAQKEIEAYTEHDVCSQKTFISFVDAVFETFGALCAGRPLVIIPAEAVYDSRAIAALIAKQGVTQLITVPSLARSIMEDPAVMQDLAGLRCWTLSGEEVPADLLINLQKELPNCEFITLYGASEVSSDATYFRSAHFQGDRVPIGRPVPNVQVYVLDDYGEPVPIGVVGEIYIGGAGVARGYLNRPELTKSRFLEDRLGVSGGRLYRTGDLGRWRADGLLEHLGRNDHQVKIRGVRIELGEIETRLLKLPQIREAVVIAREDEPGEKRLVAYMTIRAGCGTEPRIDALRAHLGTMLPHYMIPTSFVILEALPRTPNGKVDRRALPVPVVGANATRSYEAPQNEAERILAAVWGELLHAEHVGRRANFFELGGHSLLIPRMTATLRQRGLFLEARDIYRCENLAGLAEAARPVTDTSPGVPPNMIPAGCEIIQPQMLPLLELTQKHLEEIARCVPGGARNIQDIYPLLPLQEGMLFDRLLNEDRTDPYIIETVLSVPSRQALAAFVDALQAVVARHDSLRTVILWEQLPTPVQVVLREVEVPVREQTLLADRDPISQLYERDTTPRRDLDPRVAPLIILVVAADPQSERWYAALSVHHLVCDNESTERLLEEVGFYAEGSGASLPPPTAFRNHVAQVLAHSHAQDSEIFFRSKLRDVDEPTAPFGLLHVQDTQTRREARQSVDPRLATGLRALARHLNVSPATLFHTAWALVVSRTSGRNDVVFGSVLWGRLQTHSEGHQGLGLFANTLPLRLSLKEVEVGELVKQTQQELVELLNHEQASLARAQRCSGVELPLPLFTSLLNYLHRRPPAVGGKSTIESGIKIIGTRSWTNYPIVLSVEDQGEDFVLEAVTDPRLDPLRITAYMQATLQSLLKALEQAPPASGAAISILPVWERDQIIQGFNPAPTRLPQPRLIHELFEQQVARAPERAAVVYGGQSLTYGHLNRRANQLGRCLRELGVGPDILVALYVERGLDMIVGVLGILKAGGAYVPLDPSSPNERLTYMLEDAAPKVVVSQSSLKSRLPTDIKAEVIALDDLSEREILPSGNLDPLTARIEPHHLAYVIYTSGSTGRPKGVMVEHRNVTRLFAATAQWFGFNEDDVWTLFHSVAFDFSVWEIWGALLHGGRLVVVPHLVTRSPTDFYHLLCEQQVTVLNQTPSAFVQLIEAQAHSRQRHSLRLVIFGGEALEFHSLGPWVSRNGAERTQLVNMYGITETTVHVTYRRLSAQEIECERGSLVGQPILDLRLYILDGYGQPVPIGVVGEIYVGGAGVARGYLNQPGLTATRFVQDPFCGDSRGRMYRSGDLGRWRADGTLEYLGRNDHQIKIRGFRVELGEIEAQLARHPSVTEAVVLAREGRLGEKQLVGYVIPHGSMGPRTTAIEELRSHLRSVLPDYMVPAAFVLLERMPLTINGKLDRAALPAPDEHALAMRQYVAPRNQQERALCEVWQRVLGLTHVGIEDNFFALGGDSIVSLRLLTAARAAGVNFGVAELFRHQTIAKLAAAINKQMPTGVQQTEVAAFELLTVAERAQLADVSAIADAYPLSLLQEGMYFHSQLEPKSAVYHDVFSYRVNAVFDQSCFEHALVSLVQRHPVLRTSFLSSCEHRLLQIVHAAADIPLGLEDLSALTRDQQDARIRAWIDQERFHSFVWHRPPLMRVYVHVRAPHQFQYSLSFHHAILDGWSVASLQTELINHYSSLMRGKEHTIDPPRAQYRDFIARERHALQSTESREYWRSQLDGVSLARLPKLSGEVGRAKGQDIATYTVPLGVTLGRALEGRARELGVHVKVLLLAAHVKALSVMTGEHTIVTGLVSHGRLERDDAERVLGLHLNSLPLRIDLPQASWRTLVIRLREIEDSMFPHRHYPLAAIQELIRGDQLFESVFNFTRFHVYRQIEDGMKIEEVDGFEQTNFSLVANFSQELESPNVSLSLGYDPAVFDRSQLERLAGYYQRALQRMVEDIDGSHRTPVLLSDSEQDELLIQFNKTQAVFPTGQLIHEIFENHAARAPAAVAVVFGSLALSYDELNRRANQLARYLIQLGAGPMQLVAICLERTPELVIGQLAALKAGAAYVPLDPSLPAERLQYLLADAAPTILLTQARHWNGVGTGSAKTVDIDADWSLISLESGDNLDGSLTEATPSSLAYVIYTSGSTGTPKGVAVEHHSFVNLLHWYRTTFSLEIGTRCSCVAAVGFDACTWEIWTTIGAGATLVIAPPETTRDAEEFLGWWSQQALEICFLPTPLAELAFSRGVCNHGLRKLLVGGDRLRQKSPFLSFELINNYGPTESTVCATSGRISAEDSVIHIGRPIANTRVYVLDDHRQLVPVGAVGELYIGGAGVSRGYLNRPELTAERFLSDSFSEKPGARMYRSGDLVRWLADGTLEYLGRNDDQVKIRGFRIELGEIETQIRALNGIKDVVVAAREDVPGEKRLVAYLIAGTSNANLDLEALRASLRSVLPEYMVPRAFVVLARLPLTANGKLDRRALPAPGAEAFIAGPGESPRGKLELSLSEIWRDLLQVDQVGREHNFFELGGHSLNALKLVAWIAERLGAQLPLSAVFRNPVLRQMAEAIQSVQSMGTSTQKSAPLEFDEGEL